MESSRIIYMKCNRYDASKFNSSVQTTIAGGRLDWIMLLFSWKNIAQSSQNLKPLRILNILPSNPKLTPGHFEDQCTFLEKKC